MLDQRVPARWLKAVRCVAIVGGVLWCQMARAETLTVGGVIDAPRSDAGPTLIYGERGLSLPATVSRDNFHFSQGGCPNLCDPGPLDVSTENNDFGFTATLDGVSYHVNCFSCTAFVSFRINGSVVLPAPQPFASPAGRFTMTGRFNPGDKEPIDFTGSGTMTVYIHSPGSPGLPNTWSIDRIVLRFDSPFSNPWMLPVDVGQPGLAGTASQSTGEGNGSSFMVAGAGADIWGAADAFHFVPAFPTGNEIVARIDSEEQANPYAKAGLMIRGAIDAGSPHVLLDIKPDGDVEVLTRSSQDGATAYVGGGFVGFPGWLKLTKGQQAIEAAVSSDGKNWQVVASVPAISSQWEDGLKGLAVTSHDPSVLNHALFSHVTVADSATQPVDGWQQTDIGAVSIAGSATENNGELSVSGDGADIWGTADAFHFLYQGMAFDFELVARVTTLQNTSPYAKAGLMIRSDLSAGAAHVLLDVKPDGGIEFMTRTAAGAETTFVAGGAQPLPTWLKLQRSGSAITGWVSADGSAWTKIGSSMWQFQGSYTGFAVTSHNTGTLTTATFDSIDLSLAQPIPSPWTSKDAGTTGISGSAQYQEGAFTIKGAGADIWGTTDSFQYVYTLKDPGTNTLTLSARVVSETNTNLYAKAGLMIRDGFDLDAAAPFVMISIKPDGEIETLQRAAAGGTVSYLGGASAGFASFLRLQRDGSSIVLSYSKDGTDWTTVTATNVSMSGTTQIGMAVTSHDTNQLNTAVFDAVSGP